MIRSFDSRVLEAIVASSVVLLGGCGDTDTTPGGEEAPVVFDMTTHVDSGAELHMCSFVRMPKREGGVFVSGGSYETTVGTHHFLLFRTEKGMPEPVFNHPVDCYEGDGSMQYERGFVTGGQLPHDSASFPEGLALAFESDEILLFEGHFINTTSTATDAHVHVVLDTEDAASVTTHVGTFRFYDPYIYLPPQASAKAAMRCHIHHDVTLLSAGSHMHEHGTQYRAFHDVPGQAPATTPFYQTTNWLAPPYFEGSIPLAAGADIRFECDYQNTGSVPVIQGLSAITNEMCMFSGFYYPDQDDAEDDCASMDMNGTGKRSCAETSSCLDLCPASSAPNFSAGSAEVGACWQQCIVDSCPNVTGTLFPELECAEKQCKSECATPGAVCSQCIVEHCKPELDACQALDCGP